MCSFGAGRLAVISPVIRDLFGLSQRNGRLSLFTIRRVLSRGGSVGTGRFGCGGGGCRCLGRCNFFGDLSSGYLFPAFSPRMMGSEVLRALRVVFRMASSYGLGYGCYKCKSVCGGRSEEGAGSVSLRSTVVLLSFFVGN